MSKGAGVLRTGEGLTATAAALEAWLGGPAAPSPGVASWETTNLHMVATALVSVARARRGDAWLALARGLPGPGRRTLWAGHFDVAMTDGVTTVTFNPAPPSDTDRPGSDA